MGSQFDGFILEEAGFLPTTTIEEKRSGDIWEDKPRYALAENHKATMELLNSYNDIGLILSDLILKEGNPFEIMREIKAKYKEIPGVLLTSHPDYSVPLLCAPNIEPFDRLFIWHGSHDIINCIVMLFEDLLNADHDILYGGVRTIILVEDDPSLYSHYIQLIYREITERTKDLLPKRASKEEKLRRLKARTKLFLAVSYEEAMGYLQKYGDYVCGVISDLQFPIKGEIDLEAGIKLTRFIKKNYPSIPVILQSKDKSMEGAANEAGAYFIWKQSDHFLRELHNFMFDYFGFGDFIFRYPSGEEITRASNLKGLYEAIAKVPIESFNYHGKNNHFSTWLFIHGDHLLARKVRAMHGEGEEVRKELLDVIKERLKEVEGD